MYVFNIKRNIYKPAKRIKKTGCRVIKTLPDRLFFNRYLKKNTPVLVYQMGKVASSSVTKSLLRYYAGVVVSAHYFNPDHKDWRVGRLYRWVIEGANPLGIISLTREPIGRNVSAFFQNFEKHTGLPYHDANYSLDELKEFFLEKFPTRRPGHWFDRNIKDNFGIDVYVNPFPKCGYATYNHKNIRLLVMRSELNDNEKVKAIRDFLKLSEFQLINRNISAQKEYASAYEDFKRKVKLPLNYVDEMCKSKYFNHFYGQDIINVVRKKWSEIQ